MEHAGKGRTALRILQTTIATMVAALLVVSVFVNIPLAFAGTYGTIKVEYVKCPYSLLPDNTGDHTVLKNRVWEDIGKNGLYFSEKKRPTLGRATVTAKSASVGQIDTEVYLIGGNQTGSYDVAWYSRARTADGTLVDIRMHVDVEMRTPVPDGCHASLFTTGNNNFISSYWDSDVVDETPGTKQTCTIRYYEAGTDNELTGTVAAFLFRDLDIMGFNWTRDDLYTEGIEFVNGVAIDTVYCGEKITKDEGHHTDEATLEDWSEGECLTATRHPESGNLWIHGSHNCGVLPDSAATTAFKSGATFVWRGRSCGTALGLVVDKPDPVHYTPEVEKKLAGETLKSKMFTFSIKETDDNQSWQGSAEATNDASGKATFAEQEYDETGTYKYTITEDIVERGEGWVQDTHKCTLTVKVKARGTDHGPELYIDSVTYSNPTFINYHFSKPEKKVNKEEATPEETLHYTIEQKMVEREFLTAVRFMDRIPVNTEYVRDSFKVLNASKKDVTDTAGELYVGKEAIYYMFKDDYVTSKFPKDGGTFTFSFDVKVLPSAVETTVENTSTTRFNNEWDFESEPVDTDILGWYVTLEKEGTFPLAFEGNSAYSLADAQFEVRDVNDHLVGTLKYGTTGGVGILVTDDECKTSTLLIDRPGTYTVTEVKPPAGHNLADPSTWSFTCKSSNAGEENTFTHTFVDETLLYAPDIIAMKGDKDYYLGYPTGEEATHLSNRKWWQGNGGDFSGCVVQIDFRAGSSYAGAMLASAQFQADADGYIHFADATPVNGTTWKYQHEGKNVLPIGCITLREVTPPAGYTLNETVYRALVIEVDGHKLDFMPGDTWKPIIAARMTD